MLSTASERDLQTLFGPGITEAIAPGLRFHFEEFEFDYEAATVGQGSATEWPAARDHEIRWRSDRRSTDLLANRFGSCFECRQQLRPQSSSTKQSIERDLDRVAVRDWPLLDRGSDRGSRVDDVADRLGMRREQLPADTFHDNEIALALFNNEAFSLRFGRRESSGRWI